MSEVRSVLVTRNFPPLIGGMERLNQHLFASLQELGPTALVGPPGARAFVDGNAVVNEASSSRAGPFLLHAALAAARVARQLRPDIVLAGSGLTAPHAIAASRICGARAAVYVHGLDLVVRNPLYRAVWLPAIRSCHRVLVNSNHTRDLAIDAGVSSDRIRLLHPGTEIPDVTTGRADFQARYGLDPSAPVLLSVGRLTARKGLAQFIEHVLPRIAHALPDVVLLIIGTGAADALVRHEGSGAEAIERAVERSEMGRHVRLLGAVSDAVLSAAYEAADVHVFPVRELAGDVEGFGMVALEAASHGVPTIAYAVGGVPDAVADGVSGKLVQPGDSDAFAAAVVAVLKGDSAQWRSGARNFAKSFDWRGFTARLAGALSDAP